MPELDRVDHLILAGFRGESDAAERLLHEHSALAGVDARIACVLGDDAALAAALERDPGIATAPHGSRRWPLVAYACASPLHRLGPARAEGLLRCATLLLERGATANDVTPDEGESAPATPILYYACVSNHVPLVRLLLERGADPNDGESIYHSAELDHRDCLELLRAHGAELSKPHPRWHNTPLFFLAGYGRTSPVAASVLRGATWLLEHGADPNVPSGEARETPLHRAVAGDAAPAFIERLLAHGADPGLPRGDGRTPWVLALRSGNTEAQSVLEAAGGAVGELKPDDRLFAAAMRGELAAARDVLAAHPGLIDRLGPEERAAMGHAAASNRTEAVRVLAAVGFDLAWEGPWGGTPLHWAAWFGRPEAVEALLALGAPVNARDSTYGSAPIGWAGHGSQHCRSADDDYLAVVGRLAAAGATTPDSVNRWGDAPDRLASPRVAARLRELGYTKQA